MWPPPSKNPGYAPEACGTKQMIQWLSGNSGENEQRGILLKVFLFFQKISSGKGRSILFPTGTAGFSIQMESAPGIPFVLLYYALWLVKKTRATCRNQSYARFKPFRTWSRAFPRASSRLRYLLWVPIGCFCYLLLIWLAVIYSYFGFGFRHSIKKRSNSATKPSTGFSSFLQPLDSL